MYNIAEMQSSIALFLFVSCFYLVLSACPNGFIQNGDSCYLFSKLRVSWIQAMKLCEIYQGQLAVIESEAEQLYLEKYLTSKWTNASLTNAVWISGTDLMVDGDWIWAKTGQPIQYFRWSPGQPDSSHMNIGGEDCIGLDRGHKFLWNDYPCAYHNNFVCERPYLEE